MFQGNSGKIKKFAIGIAVSTVFLYLALKDVEWEAFANAIKSARYWYLLPAIIATMTGHYFRAFRWKFMLLPVKRISTSRLFEATAIGFMANNLLPARLGEVVRAYMLGRTEGISKTASFATIVYERIIDVFALLLLLWFVLIHQSGLGWLRVGGLWILAANVGLLVMLFWMERNRGTTERIVDRLVGKMPGRFREKALHVTGNFLEGLKVIGETRSWGLMAVLSLPVWVGAILAIYFSMGAMELQASYLTLIILIVLISLGSMIPSAPAYIGTTQYACIIGLSLVGVDKSAALAFSLLFHATQFFPITALGLFYLWRRQIGFEEISESETTPNTI